MGSLNAIAVAHDVAKTVMNGQKVNIGKIVFKHGYSKAVSLAPTKVTKTKSYQNIIKNIVPNMEKQRARMIEAIGKKNLGKEKLQALTSGLDILTKNIQLLSGKATENVSMIIEVSEAVAKKNAQKEQVVNNNKDTK